MDDDRLASALADIGKNDPDAVTLADGVYQWVAGEDGIDTITLSRVQRFAWYDLSVKWLITDQEREDVLAAGAALFDALGLTRYALVMTSSLTSEIVDAHKRSYEDGLKAFQKALDASGIDPPDVEDFEWSDMMGIEENSAYLAAELALEQAMNDGRMTPGSRGWKSMAKVITVEVLDTTHPEFPGQSWRTAIMTERIQGRLHRLNGRSRELHAMLSNTANRLLSPIPAPPDLELSLEPITWFLVFADEDLKMTGAGYLPTSMVRDAANRFGWDKGWSDDPPKKESDSRELLTLHQLLLDTGAIHHRKGVVIRTNIGSKMLEDPEYTWRTVSASLTQHEWLGAVAQAYTLLLLAGEDDEETLWDRTHALLVEYGWRTGDEPPERLDVMSAWWTLSRPLEMLGGMATAGLYPSRTVTLTPFGEATLLERLRLDVNGPVRRP